MKPFTFYDIYYAPIKEMDDRQAGKFFRMICDFSTESRSRSTRNVTKKSRPNLNCIGRAF